VVEVRRLQLTEQRAIEAAKACSEAYSEAEALWECEEDPPDWIERMKLNLDRLEDAEERFLEASKR
jgi:hypothetical protein